MAKPHLEKSKKEFDVSRLVFKLAFLTTAFLVGGVFGKFNMHPFNLMDRALKDSVRLTKQVTQSRPQSLLRPRRYQGDGVTRHKVGQAYPGLTIMQGWFSDGLQLRLVRMNGEVIHRWDINYRKIWPHPTHVYPTALIPPTQYNLHSQGMFVFPDGSIMANLESLGTFKMDRCGKVLWTVDRMTHHSITQTDEGFWIPINEDPRVTPDRLFPFGVRRDQIISDIAKMGGHAGYEQKLMLIDGNGKIKRELSVLEALFNAELEPELFDTYKIRSFDPTHVNDIVEVTEPLAERLTGVEPGNLLISIRQLHMLAILDHHTGALKWSVKGNWVRQHDPDITPEGKIIIFNNRPRFAKIGAPPGSNIIEIEPESGKSRVLFPQEGQTSFYTDIVGMHEALPNENRLIVESRFGRVFEIDSLGEVIWEYIASYDEQFAAFIDAVIRVPNDYFSVEEWSCD